MDMEVVVAVPPPPISMDFNFDSNCSSPYMTAPSSPQRFGNNFFFSAPTSPTRASSVFHQARHSSASSSSTPSRWEHPTSLSSSQPTINTNNNNDATANEEDFEFNFSGQLERPSLSADELFDGGKIKPLKLNSEAKKIVQVPLNKKDSNSFHGTRKRVVVEEVVAQQKQQQQQQKRGTERASSFSISSTSSSSSGRKGSSRNSSSVCDSEDVSQSDNKHVSSPTSNTTETSATEAATTSSFATFLSSISFTKGYRKWRLKDFLLFRSASEGRATDKDPLRKYAVLSKTTAHEDVRNSSFRSTKSSGSVSRRRGPVSAHELHYTVNRAASEELKKKTLLPYKQGLLGCLGFNTGMRQISRRIGSLERS